MNKSGKETGFLLDRKTPIVLYGAATIGSLLYNHLVKKGYRVKGFIDKRAKEIKELCGLPVYDIDDECLSPNDVIIIAVKNVWEHGRIANELIKKGFQRLIFRPYACLEGKGSKEEKELNTIYDKMTDLTEKKFCFEGNIPLSNQSSHRELIVDILEEEEETITIYVPVTLLYTDKKSTVPEFSVLFLKPHLQFIRYVLGLEGGSVENYIQYCLEGASRVGGFETTEAWKENVIRSRAEVYIKMNHMYNLEKNFFVKQAPYVHWNDEKKYFNLQSGKHRVTFLAAKGDNYIAVKMKRDDYKDWAQEKLVGNVRNILEDKFWTGKTVPIENPFFYEYSCLDEQFWYQMLRKMMEKISEIYYIDSSTDLLIGKRFLVSIRDYGFVKRFLKRCGFQVFTSDDCEEIEMKINAMLGFDEVEQKSVDANETYDYAIISGNIDTNENIFLNSTNTFLISEKEYENADRIMTGIYQDKKVSVYLVTNYIDKKGRINVKI